MDPSTVFLDFLGPLGPATTQGWTADAENAAVATVAQQITAAVRKGFLTRAAADWQVRKRSCWCCGTQGLELKVSHRAPRVPDARRCQRANPVRHCRALDSGIQFETRV